MRLALPDLAAEWLEANSCGGFASGTVSGERTRRYHALLLTATTPPTGRMVLVNGLEASIERQGGTWPLSRQHYAPDTVYPDGSAWLHAFTTEPWPTWTFALPDGTVVVQECLVHPAACETVLRWRMSSPGGGPCRLSVRLLLSGRDYHALHSENDAFRFDATCSGGNVCWHPYPDVPAVSALTNGTYRHAPVWFRRFLYVAERARGLDNIEDLASPGVFTFDLSTETAVLVLRAGESLASAGAAYGEMLMEAEAVRRSTCGGLARAGAAYLANRAAGKTVIAGYPWFTDWGRDTFIAMRGLVFARGDMATAEHILVAWAGEVSEGMLPNRFPDGATAPDYNAVDASLWFIVAVHDFLGRCETMQRKPRDPVPARLHAACTAILEGYMAGTRFGIRADADGLLSAGVPGLQLTWMDAKTGDHVVTPRIGKPVEVQALWINALRIATIRLSPGWAAAADRAQAAFTAKFPRPGGGLHDVLDVDHVPGLADGSVRPNQIFAAGGLPFRCLDTATARAVVDEVEVKLLTPLGLRSLSPDDPGYIGRYAGGPAERDGAYHQGTVWPWLMGPFVDAWLAVRGRTPAAKAEAARRFLPGLMAHLDEAGLGHVSEVADGDAPHTPGGCPFQAWSLGELIRIREMLDLCP